MREGVGKEGGLEKVEGGGGSLEQGRSRFQTGIGMRKGG